MADVMALGDHLAIAIFAGDRTLRIGPGGLPHGLETKGADSKSGCGWKAGWGPTSRQRRTNDANIHGCDYRRYRGSPAPAVRLNHGDTGSAAGSYLNR